VEFRAAAHAITDPAGNEPTETKAAGRGGGDSHRATAAALVEDYLRLCRNPAQDILRWLKETDDSPGVVYLTRPIRRGERDVLVLSQKSTSELEKPGWIRGDTLHEMQVRLDAHRPERIADGLPPRSPARPLGDDQMRSLRPTDHPGGTPTAATFGAAGTDAAGEFATDLAALSATFAARGAAIRRAVRPGDVAALLRALKAEQTLVQRNVLDRWCLTARKAGEQRAPPGFANPKTAESLPTRPSPHQFG
jgi:hypothetical protein